MTHTSSCRVPPCFNTCRLWCHSEVYPEWHFFLLHRGPARPLPPFERNGLLPFQHGGLWSRTSHVRRELLRRAGLHPLHKWSHCTDAGSKSCVNLIGQRNGVWPSACVTSRSGRASRSGDPCPNPQGAGTDGPYLLLSLCVPPTTPYGGDVVPKV